MNAPYENLCAECDDGGEGAGGVDGFVFKLEDDD